MLKNEPFTTFLQNPFYPRFYFIFADDLLVINKPYGLPSHGKLFKKYFICCISIINLIKLAQNT